ncbi:RNA 2',3'-cyclic phosphodiesterase [Mesorhizobium sp. WSM2239]|uniref:RNA 2',3'-cyclic phosphodiesterase n=2 Tax=unclassified Mesorhizobium TaxID=325217 RepID=A0AAU8DG01_9HYPH
MSLECVLVLFYPAIMQTPKEIWSIRGRKVAVHPGTGAWQPTFPGMEIRRLDNIFFAIRPGEAAASQIHDIAQSLGTEFGLRGRLLDRLCLHITLHGVGEFEGLPRSRIAQANEAASSVSMPAFDVGFDRAMSFGGNGQSSPLVLRGSVGHAELRRLHRLLGEAMRRVGLWRAVRSSFTRM